MTLHLVRHGRPTVDSAEPAHEWTLDPAGYDAVWALRESGTLPARAAWFTSPEPKAIETAQLLTDGQVGVLDELAEQRRSTWAEDFETTVRRAFADPDRPAYDGWEPLAVTRARVVPAVRRAVEVHAGQDVVMVGHGTAWTLVAAELSGEAPDLSRWSRLEMPDVISVEV